MKKILSLLLSITMLFSITAGLDLTAYAQTIYGSCGGRVSYALDTDSDSLIISGKGKMTDYSWESSAPWYYKSSSLKTVEIKSGVTSIGDYAFRNCSSLTSVTIGDSVASIGECAFEYCDSLTSITIPNSVTSIGNYAFRNCSSLTSVTIPDSVTSIGYDAFQGCSSLTNVTIGNSLTSIDGSPFRDCSSLTSITVDSNNQYYSSQDGVLFNKDKTDLIQYPIGNTRTSYTILDSVTSIGHSAFEDCSSLTSVTIPSSVTSIGMVAFSGCSSLTSITVDSDNSYYSSQDGVLYNIDKTTLIQYPIGNTRTSYSIPDSVTSIYYYAFSGCSSLTSVTIPDSVTSIGWNAFENCSSLIDITIPNRVTSIDSSTFEGCRGLTSVTIPDSVTSIGNYAFYNCSSLTSVTIPDSVTSIGKEAFYNCSSLIDITIPNRVTSIDRSTFLGCSSLTSVTIPNSVTSIGYGAFNGCSSLKDVYYSGSEAEWKAISIESHNEGLTNATIHYHQHIYSDVATPPSCIEGGYTTHTCIICGDSYVDSYTSPTGHIFNGGKNCVVCGLLNPNYVEPTPNPTPTPQPHPTPQPTTTQPAQSQSNTPADTQQGVQSTQSTQDVSVTTQQPNTQPISQVNETTTVKAKATSKKPKSTSIKKLTKGKKSFKITFKKVTGISGYEVQYATDKKFKKNKKSVTVKKNKTSATVKKLKSGKKYYVRVRTYKTVNGKKIYSSWSKLKSVKTK